MSDRDERYDDENDDRDDDYERPRRRRRRENRDDDFQPTEVILPTNVSAYSIIACYAGFVGMCIPIAGLIFTIPALICGIIALRTRQKKRTYGAVTSDFRAILGLIFCAISLLYHGAFLVSALLKK